MITAPRPHHVGSNSFGKQFWRWNLTLLPLVPCAPGGTLLPYYLDEENNWALDMANLKSQVDAARADGKSVRRRVSGFSIAKHTTALSAALRHAPGTVTTRGDH
jgi:hypothetical protein